MKRCPSSEGTRHYRLPDGCLKCPACGHRFTWTSVWDLVRLPATAKLRLLDLFVLGRTVLQAAVRQYDERRIQGERCYRRLSACCTSVEQLRDPFEAASNATKPPSK